jgi:hypothetical protein
MPFVPSASIVRRPVADGPRRPSCKSIQDMILFEAFFDSLRLKGVKKKLLTYDPHMK